MTKKLQVGDELFDYPVTGDSNFGEDATAWAEAVSDTLTEVRGPGDIPVSEVQLLGLSGNISGLSFDTSFVQRILIEGIIIRTTIVPNPEPPPADPTITIRDVESFKVEGAHNGSDFNISVDYSGDDTQVTIDVVGGQFTFSTPENDSLTTTIIIKFKAKTIIDEEVLGL
jgi:hypothetical protein